MVIWIENEYGRKSENIRQNYLWDTSCFNLIKIFLLMLLLFANSLFAIPGRFLLLGNSPLGTGMGQALCSSRGVPEGAFYNPASLLGVECYELGGNWQELALDRKLYSVVATGMLREEAAFQIMWLHSGVGDVIGRDEDGNPTNELRNGDDNFSLTFAKKIWRGLSGGVNVRYVQAVLPDMLAYSAGMDFGMSYKHFLPIGTIVAGLSVQNIGLNYDWNSNDYWGNGYSSRDDFPPTYRGGVSFQFQRYPIMFAVEGEKTDAMDTKPHIGILVKPAKGFEIFGGVSGKLPAMGMTIDMPIGKQTGIKVGYAFSQESEGLSPRHIIGLSVWYH